MKTGTQDEEQGQSGMAYPELHIFRKAKRGAKSAKKRN
jgi:hypothetical protein